MSSAGTEMEVRLRLAATGEVDREEIEERIIQVLEAVEEHAADVALDPVVSADFGERVIAMRFQINVVNLADLPDRMSVVLDAISTVVPLSLESMNADRIPETDDRVLELA